MADRSTLGIEHAALALGVVMLLLILISPLAIELGLAGIALVQLAAFAAPPAVIAQRVSGSLAGAAALLGVRRTGARSLVGAALIGGSFWCVSLWLIVPLSVKLFGGQDELERLHDTFFGSGLPTVVVLLVVSVTPALCEELLHRGVLTRAIHSRFGAVAAVLGSAIIFGLMHFQLPRMLPAGSLGLILGFAAVVSGSIVPGILIHFMNNAIAVLLASGAMPGVVKLIEEHPNGIGAAAVVTSLLGLWLLWSDRRPGSKSPNHAEDPGKSPSERASAIAP